MPPTQENYYKYQENMSEIRLTQYSHGAGCGCKIAPSVLSSILESKLPQPTDKNLIVGNDTRDDAAVYDLGDGTALISTTDFFMPIVDDPHTFGRIAATNALSDVYAMGGQPLVAIAILGWPVDKLEAEVAGTVIEGGRSACKDAGIILAGGHSIDSPEPIFGLAVTGRVDLAKLKRNSTAEAGCRLYLTKPLGVGIFSTAQKKKKLKNEHTHRAPEAMTLLNSVGMNLAELEGVRAMTDVTGFGLLGHLTEMCESSSLSAEITLSEVPKMDDIQYYIDEGCIPGGTHRNWSSYGDGIQLQNESDRLILCDPQTSGGLLIAVQNESSNEVESLLREEGLHAQAFGQLIPEQNEFRVKVI